MLLPLAMSLVAVLPPPAAGSEACPALFGDESVHEQNRTRRRALLRFIDPSPYAISVAHSAEWDEPEAVSFLGVRLVKTDISSPKRRAIVEVSGSTSCRPGRYVIERDDAIGQKTSVLAILDGLVLVEHLGSLLYFHSEHVALRPFSMVWSSPWPMNPYLPRSSSALRSTSTPATPRKKR